MFDLHNPSTALPDEWQIKRFDDLFDIQQGKQVSKRNRLGSNLKPFLRTRNVLWGQVDLAELDEMHFTDEEMRRLRLLPNDLLICEGGDIGRTAIWEDGVEDCFYQNHLHRARLKTPDHADARYALYWLWYAFEFANVYFGRGNVTTIPNLSRSRLAELPLPVPPLDEQRKIAAVLSLVQRAIEQQERLIALTTELKQSLMHKLFTEGLHGEEQKETEIGSVPVSWELMSFADAVEIARGQVDPRLEPYKSMLHVGPENIEPNTGRLSDLETNGTLSVRSGNYFFDGHNVLYSKIRPYLNKVALPDFEGTCSADMYPLRPQSEYLTREYLFQFLLSDPFKQQAISFQDRTGIPKINRAQLGSILMPIPPIEEQVRIASALRACDAHIGTREQNKDLLIELFRTLLHQLMSAQIRVNHLDWALLEGPEANGDEATRD